MNKYLKTFIFLSLAFSTMLIFPKASFSCEESLSSVLEALPNEVLENVAFSDMDSVIREAFNKKSKSKFDYVVVLEQKPEAKVVGLYKEDLLNLVSPIEDKKQAPLNSEVTKILGFTEKEALILSGDPTGNSSCSEKHQSGKSIASRWCSSKIASATTSAINFTNTMSKQAANILAAAVFIPKDLVTEQSQNSSNLVITNFPLYDDPNSSKKVNMTVFGDGVFHIQFDMKF